jgi:hypothetical protein
VCLIIQSHIVVISLLLRVLPKKPVPKVITGDEFSGIASKTRQKKKGRCEKNLVFKSGYFAQKKKAFPKTEWPLSH